tara:strand:+ start:1984 stop:2337 length:354 start_codon:yes stop_codon:yes gene_type:complete
MNANVDVDDITVYSYVEFEHNCKNHGIGVGIVDGTEDLYIERFMKVADENVTLQAFTCFNAVKGIDNFKDDAKAMKSFYLEKLQRGYKNNTSFRKMFHPLVYDFPIFTGVTKRVLEL